MSAPNLGRVQRNMLVDLHKRGGLSLDEMQPYHGTLKQCCQVADSLNERGFAVAYFEADRGQGPGRGSWSPCFVYRINTAGIEALRWYGDIPAKPVDTTVNDRMARMRERKRDRGLIPVSTWVPKHMKTKLLDLALDWCDNPRPAWVRCPDCDDFLCTIHGGHVHDCDCPTIDELDFDPYVTSSA
jgi:hypothetical protein